MLKRCSKAVVAIALGLYLSGCATTPVEQGDSVPLPLTAEQLRQLERQKQEYELALVSMREGNYPLAIKELNIFVERHPDYPGPYVNLGILYHRMNRLDEAEKALLKAVALNPKSAVAQNRLGMVYRERGRFNEALAAYKSAIAADEEYADAYLNLGILYDLYLFEGEKALQHYIRYQLMTANDDAQVAMWVTELAQRLKAPAPAIGPIK